MRVKGQQREGHFPTRLVRWVVDFRVALSADALFAQGSSANHAAWVKGWEARASEEGLQEGSRRTFSLLSFISSLAFCTSSAERLEALRTLSTSAEWNEAQTAKWMDVPRFDGEGQGGCCCDSPASRSSQVCSSECAPPAEFFASKEKEALEEPTSAVSPHEGAVAAQSGFDTPKRSGDKQGFSQPTMAPDEFECQLLFHFFRPAMKKLFELLQVRADDLERKTSRPLCSAGTCEVQSEALFLAESFAQARAGRSLSRSSQLPCRERGYEHAGDSILCWEGRLRVSPFAFRQKAKICCLCRFFLSCCSVWTPLALASSACSP